MKDQMDSDNSDAFISEDKIVCIDTMSDVISSNLTSSQSIDEDSESLSTTSNFSMHLLEEASKSTSMNSAEFLEKTDVSQESDSGDHVASKAFGAIGIMPRPPTPPKQLDDEDMKPSIIDVGQISTHKTSVAEPLRSILKHPGHNPNYGMDWINKDLCDLLHWRNPVNSVLILSAVFLATYLLQTFSIIVLICYAGLIPLCVTFSLRIYKIIESRLNKSEEGNVFQPYLGEEFRLPKDKIHQYVNRTLDLAENFGSQLRSIFLMEDIAASVKFGILLWAFTYIATTFSTLCILNIGIVGLFTIPKIYEVYNEEIDEKVNATKGALQRILQITNEKLPFLAKHFIKKRD